MKIAVLFPGQGSQYIGMGADFIESDPDCASIMETAESVCDFSIRELILNGPMEELTRAVYLQPSITVTNLICYHALSKALKSKFTISCFAGHSLGEYSALYAAGVLSLEDTLRLVARRGALMEREGDKNPGGMRAVIGLTLDELEKILNEYSGNGVVTIANHNTSQQIVISGEINAMDEVENKIEKMGGRVIPLNVIVANHSPLVAGAVPDFDAYMKTISFHKPKTPVYFNISSKKEEDTDTIRNMMASQIASRVRWFEVISNMMKEGVDTFIEVGPKTVLKGMVRKIAPKGIKYTALQLDSPETLEKCMKKLG